MERLESGTEVQPSQNATVHNGEDELFMYTTVDLPDSQYKGGHVPSRVSLKSIRSKDAELSGTTQRT